jgi:UPF0755 protein
MRRRRRRLLTSLAVLVAVVAVIAFGAWWTLGRRESDVAPGKKIEVTIPKGASTAQVASLLAREGVIDSSMMFNIRARTLGVSSELKPGVYAMTTGSDYDTVARLLSQGPSVVFVTLTIPEGWTIDQISRRVEAKTGVPAKEFADMARTGKKLFPFAFLDKDPGDSLEGYLFPKTYQVREKSTASTIIGMMLAQYEKETADVDYSYAVAHGLTEHDVLTIASIIEREATLQKDRPLVASVIYNRLAKHMKLQLDSTVMFVIGNRERLYLSDLKVQSPYNTYLHYGLPPGPIANPGIESIQAAASPAKTGYYYYIMDHKDGSQSFTKTYEEFLRLKAQAAKGLK